MAEMTNTERLEAMVDSYGMKWVLDALSEIAAGKAQHLRENWQDDTSAKLWERAAVRIDVLADSGTIWALGEKR